MLRLMDTPADVCGPVNIGNPDEFTMLELAQITLSLTGSPSPLTFKPLPGDDPHQRKPDITQARNLLNWQPTVPLEEGLTRTIAHFRKVLD